MLNIVVQLVLPLIDTSAAATPAVITNAVVVRR
jgi:hypothetical protein